LIVGVALGLQYYLSPNQYVTSPEQSPLTVKTDSQNAFVFGKLTQTYVDKQSGFSFKYPAELTLIKHPDSCPYFVDNLDSKSPLFVILTPDCSPITVTASIDGYMKDYTLTGEENTQTLYHLLNNENTKNMAGLAVLRQAFSVNPIKQLTNDSPDNIVIQNRYILKLPKNGFLIIVGPSINSYFTYYSLLEKSIIDGVTYP
ncbi:MAG: hypothetical protein NTZ38_02170, partial [Candidatus Taylorbacteria bacterium]|nr:hypothetical protein [Candidatus Taylorbacteria bacterium]